MVPYEDNLLQMSCPCCGEKGKETLKHYLVECNKFCKEREEMSSRIKNRLGMDPEADLDIWMIFKIVIGIDFYSEYGFKSNTTDDTVVKKGKTNLAEKHIILRELRVYKSSDCIFTRRKETSRKVLCELYGRSWNVLTKEKSNWRESVYCEEVARYLTITFNTRKECVGKWLGLIREDRRKRDIDKNKRTNRNVRKRPNRDRITTKAKRPKLAKEVVE